MTINFGAWFWENFIGFIPNLIFIIILVVIGHFAGKIIDRSYKQIIRKIGERFDIRISRVGIKIIVYGIIGFLIVVNIPGISESIVQTVGLVITAIVAFSSSTIIANMMSGIMIKIIQPYKTGDIVRVGEDFGEVAKVGLLHTEIETPQKEIVTVPNNEVMKGAVSNYSEDYPMVKIDVALGYNLPRIKVEKMLLKAADNAGLKKCFVSVTELGDYAVSYTVNGVLDDVKSLPFVESNLRKNIIDVFHVSKLEIMSPQYISHRKAGKNIVPKVTRGTKKELEEKEARERKGAKKLQEEIYAEAEKIIKEEEKKKREVLKK